MGEKTFKIVGDDISDGFHTFDELYEHRLALFIALLHSVGADHVDTFKSRKHADGSTWDGWFIAGMKLKGGWITYHLPERLWEFLEIAEKEQAVEWDGHTSADVVARLYEHFTS